MHWKQLLQQHCKKAPLHLIIDGLLPETSDMGKSIDFTLAVSITRPLERMSEFRYQFLQFFRHQQGIHFRGFA